MTTEALRAAAAAKPIPLRRVKQASSAGLATQALVETVKPLVLELTHVRGQTVAQLQWPHDETLDVDSPRSQDAQAALCWQVAAPGADLSFAVAPLYKLPHITADESWLKAAREVQLFEREGEWWLRNRGAAWTCALQGTRVGHKDVVRIRDGDVLELGLLAYRVWVERQPPAVSTHMQVPPGERAAPTADANSALSALPQQQEATLQSSTDYANMSWAQLLHLPKEGLTDSQEQLTQQRHEQARLRSMLGEGDTTMASPDSDGDPAVRGDAPGAIAALIPDPDLQELPTSAPIASAVPKPDDDILAQLHRDYVRTLLDPTLQTGNVDVGLSESRAVDSLDSNPIKSFERMAEQFDSLHSVLHSVLHSDANLTPRQHHEAVESIESTALPELTQAFLKPEAAEDVMLLFAPNDLVEQLQARERRGLGLPELVRREHHQVSMDSAWSQAPKQAVHATSKALPASRSVSPTRAAMQPDEEDWQPQDALNPTN